MGWYGFYLSGTRWGPVEGSCETDNEPSGSKKILKIFTVVSCLVDSQEELNCKEVE
jgi:hypothetical protein